MVKPRIGCNDLKMAKDNQPTCELRLRGEWVPIGLSEALRLHSSRDKRCPECHGKVRAHKEAENGMRAHFEHFEAHEGCSLGPVFSGHRSRHRSPML